MADQVPFEYEFRERANVLVQDMEQWDGSPEGLDAISREWVDLASQDHITATLTVFGDALTLGPDYEIRTFDGFEEGLSWAQTL